MVDPVRKINGQHYNRWYVTGVYIRILHYIWSGYIFVLFVGGSSIVQTRGEWESRKMIMMFMTRWESAVGLKMPNMGGT